MSQELKSVLLVTLLVLLYLVMAFRMAWLMKRSGRPFWLWLAISVCFTGIPAAAMSFRDHMRGYCPADLEDEDEADEEDEIITCPKCKRTMKPRELRRLSGKPKCPHCGRKIDVKSFE